ncbi:MAG TPA: hypothetical protein VKT77_23475 [Chthonomonadaceae bacterium]|nr:hypothetical protein [Chthonomonadaceae bacterium]
MLAYLLDENISFVVADQVALKNPQIVIHSVHRWHGGEFVGQDDLRLLKAASSEGLTLVAYDLKTIPPLLAEIAADGESHGGVIFIDASSIRGNEFGRLVTALLADWSGYSSDEWTDRIAFLEPT